MNLPATTQTSPNPVSWLEFAVSALGAFLLFLVQPWIGKQLLPWWGGICTTWAITMAFFQVAVLCGYVGAHLLFGSGTSRGRIGVFAALVALSVATLTRDPASVVSAIEVSSPTAWSQFLLLTTIVGFQAVVLALTSPSLQAWRAHAAAPATDLPLSLYAASNLGSLLGLVGYSFLFEPWFATPAIWQFWSVAYVVWAVGFVVVALQRGLGQRVLGPIVAHGQPPDSDPPQNPEGQALPALDFLKPEWIVPALAGSASLTAVTNALTQDVPAVPQIWTFTLAVYLLSYILVFRRGQLDLFWWLGRAHHFMAFCLLVVIAVHWQLNMGTIVQSALLLLFLFFTTILAHGALVWRAPDDPRQLTGFYIALAIGGALGSSLVALVAPMVFTALGELPLALVLTAAAIWNRAPWRRDPADTLIVIRAIGAVAIFGLVPAALVPFYPHTLPFMMLAILGMMGYGFVMMSQVTESGKNQALVLAIVALCFWVQDIVAAPGSLRFATRTPYGIYRVFDREGVRYLRVGTTFHGHQVLDGPDRGRPMFYYHPVTPIGAFFARTTPTWTRSAVVGLGAGVLAAFGRPGQSMDFYELDPMVVTIAKTQFDYLSTASATVRCFVGDGRLQLRHQASASYDMVVLDCFSSDAVPVHLLTREALTEIRRLVVDDGVVMYHVSNSTFNLAPLVHAAARELGLSSRQAENPAESTPRAATTRWVAVGSEAALMRHLAGLSGWHFPATASAHVAAWTDQHSSLWTAWPPDLSMFKPAKPDTVAPR